MNSPLTLTTLSPKIKPSKLNAVSHLINTDLNLAIIRNYDFIQSPFLSPES